jgi:hypothetical protein
LRGLAFALNGDVRRFGKEFRVSLAEDFRREADRRVELRLAKWAVGIRSLADRFEKRLRGVVQASFEFGRKAKRDFVERDFPRIEPART